MAKRLLISLCAAALIGIIPAALFDITIADMVVCSNTSKYPICSSIPNYPTKLKGHL